jgi:hypothetical protein
MAERFNAVVLKTTGRKARGFESLSLRPTTNIEFQRLCFFTALRVLASTLGAANLLALDREPQKQAPSALRFIPSLRTTRTAIREERYGVTVMVAFIRGWIVQVMA